MIYSKLVAKFVFFRPKKKKITQLVLMHTESALDYIDDWNAY